MMLTTEEIGKEAHSWSEGWVACNDQQSFIKGAEWAKKHYENEIETMQAEIKEKLYGENKVTVAMVHLLRNFTTDQLISIRDFLIYRTPKENE